MRGTFNSARAGKEPRRSFLKKAGSVVALAVSGRIFAKKRREKPNVILIMTDDQGYGDLRCHGNVRIRTPNLDRLYRESVRLTNYHVSPTCSPTRAALLTGHYSNRAGVWHTIMGRSILPRDEITMAQIFALNGYHTGIFGKWHLGDNFPSRPQDKGFQECVVHGGGGIGQTPDWWGNDYFDDTYFKNGRPHRFTGYCTDVFFREALNFIERNKDGPFFCYLPTNAPHGPYRVPERYASHYRKADVPSPNFYGMIENIDENVGRLLSYLRNFGLEENTIVIFTTDNGTAAGITRRGGRVLGYNAGMRGKKGSEYDGGHRVPFFIRWPAGGVTGGRDIDRLTAHIDVFPTLIDLCGLKVPDGLDFDGKSLTSLIRGESSDWPDRVVVVDSQRIDHPRKWRKCSVMTERWRLVNGEELYDIRKDPSQRENVARDYPEVVKRLRRAYEQWWERVSERFDRYARIVLGDPAENPSRLTCHDWHGPRVPWSQSMIRAGMVANGFWAVEIAREGLYEFTLRWYPKEEDKVILAEKARIKIGKFEETKTIPKGACEVKFRAKLSAGKTELRTWFIEKNGRSRGAYFVYVERIRR